jgi:hypothetical protein
MITRSVLLAKVLFELEMVKRNTNSEILAIPNVGSTIANEVINNRQTMGK